MLALLGLFVVWRREVRGVLDGIVYGALLGLGFAALENVLYLTLAALQGGEGGLVRGVYLRGVLYGLNHAAFTATTGAALGYALGAAAGARAVVVALAGLAAAALQHVLWNAVASEAIVQLLCSPLVPEGACQDPPSSWAMYVTAPLLVALFIGPSVAILLTIATRSRSWRTT